MEHRVDTYCREVTANRSNTIKKKKQKKNMYTDRRGNTSGQESHAEAERKIKHKSLYTEIQLMWKMKCMIAPIITEATKTVTKKFKHISRPYQENMQ